MNLHQRLFSEVKAVRYVATLTHDELSLHQRPGIDGASEESSDRYEELFVNPAVLLLTKQRGEIDCGGLRYVLIRYGNFFQYVAPTDSGHVSVAIERDADVASVTGRISAILAEDR